MRRGALAAAVAALVAAASVSAAIPRDHALVALNILPPGQGPTVPSLTSQEAMYDGLTPLRGSVSTADLRRLYKPATLGLGGEKAVRVERPRTGVTIDRDRFDVPHIYGTTRANTEFGAGWATAEDRGVLPAASTRPGAHRRAGRPGLRPVRLALSATTFTPSAQTEAFLAAQVKLAERTAHGRQLVKDVDAYIAGINAYFKQQGGSVQPFTRNDVIALGALIGSIFGEGGGHEAPSAQFLSDLQARLGAAKGLAVWNDLREPLDPDTPVTIARRFPYEAPQAAPGPGNLTIDAGSFQPITAGPPPPRRVMSNAMLIGAKRSASGHPIFVAGPQVGYFAPEILMEEDLHGGGLDAPRRRVPRARLLPQIGRGPDYAWSATSSQLGRSATSSPRRCAAATAIAVSLQGAVRADGRVRRRDARRQGRLESYRTTVHGPVVGYATSGGKPVAISLAPLDART